MANKLLGQHFLRNAAVAEKIAHAVMPRRGEIVFEIGAGHGELTRLLARTCTENGARLLSIEKDAALADALSGSLAPGENGAIEIVHGDALKFFASARLKEEVRNHPYRVVGNIPYYLTGRLLRILSEVERWPVRCVIMIQREVAERIMAQPPHMNRLAASVQFWAEPSILTTVSKENFQPMPAVDSAVIMLDSKNTVFSARYYAAVRALFAQPRKMILNNIAVGHSLTKDEANKDAIAENLWQEGLDPAARPQDLTIQSIMKIANTFFQDDRPPARK